MKLKEAVEEITKIEAVTDAKGTTVIVSILTVLNK